MQRERKENRLAFAMLLALSAGLFVALFKPADHVKADLRADARSFVLSLEYSAKAIEGR